MDKTPQQTMQLTGPAANRRDDPELQAIEDFSLVSLQHQPGELTATIDAPSSPGEVEEYHDAILYLDQLGFTKRSA
jgi:hypothetical protein